MRESGVRVYKSRTIYQTKLHYFHRSLLNMLTEIQSFLQSCKWWLKHKSAESLQQNAIHWKLLIDVFPWRVPKEVVPDRMNSTCWYVNSEWLFAVICCVLPELSPKCPSGFSKLAKWQHLTCNTQKSNANYRQNNLIVQMFYACCMRHGLSGPNIETTWIM